LWFYVQLFIEYTTNAGQHKNTPVTTQKRLKNYHMRSTNVLNNQNLMLVIRIASMLQLTSLHTTAVLSGILKLSVEPVLVEGRLKRMK